ncbi:MAG TPA: cytochrome P450 [Gaiellaceae bacterium]
MSLVADGLLFDPLVTNCAADPYPLYRRLRLEDPVHRCSGRDLWVLSRFDDLDWAAREWELFSSAGTLASADVNQILFTDPPLHDRLRAVVRDRFRAPTVAALEPRLRALAADLRSELDEAGTVDLARQFAWPLALAAVSDLVGVPPGEREELLRALQRRTYASHFATSGGDPAAVEAEADAVLAAAFEALLAARSTRVTDDLLGDVASAVAAGALAMPDAVRLVDFLFEGLDTAANLVASALRSLVVERPAWPADGGGDLVQRAAVEELIRFDSPIQGTFRVTTGDVSRHGVTIPARSLVYMLFASANRDEARYEDAERLLLSRRPSRLLAFGTGTHVCPGAPLARLLLRLALPTLLELAPRYDVVDVERPVNEFTRAILGLTCVPR